MSKKVNTANLMRKIDIIKAKEVLKHRAQNNAKTAQDDLKIIDFEKRAKNSLRLILDEIFPLDDADLEYFGILAHKIDNPYKRLHFLLDKLRLWFQIRDDAYYLL